MRDESFVRKPYQATDFAAAVAQVNRQRCQRCEGKVRFNNQTSKPDNEGIVTLAGICTECHQTHSIIFNINNFVVREV
jgi:hypothetical protein